MRCYLPWAQAFVNGNGTIAPCCAPIDMGNVGESSLQSLFTGSEYNRLRSDLGAGRKTEATAHCDNCYTIRKLAAGKRSFDAVYSLGDNTEEALNSLEGSHPAFVANYRLVRQAYLDGTPLPSEARPLRLEVQLGEHCDIRCIMCWQDHSRPRMLRGENFDQIREMLPYVVSVLFTGGEPTIFKEFWKLVDTFKDVAQPYAKFHILTHGQHLKDNLERFDGIQNMTFAVNVDGPNKEVYEKIRFGSSWEKMTASLEAVAEAKKTRPGWFLNTTFLLMRSNIDLIEEAIDFAERYDASFGCGMVAGEYTPVAQCRTYFNENLFRFDHLDYSKDQIVEILKNALPRADRHPYAIARGNLEATIKQVCETHQIHVPAERAAEMRAMTDDNELSRAILALVLDDAKRRRPPIDQLRADLASARETSGVHSEAAAKLAIALALRLIDDGEIGEAEVLLHEAVTALRRLNDADPADIARAQLHLGKCMATRASSGAEKELNRAWIELTGLLGRHHTQTAEAALETGRALLRLEAYDDALIALEHAYEAYLKIYGKQDDSSYIAVAAAELGKAYLHTNRAGEAEKPLRRAVQIFEKMWGVESGITCAAAFDLADSYIVTGRLVEARALLTRYQKHCEMKLGADHMLPQIAGQYLVKADVAAQTIVFTAAE